MICKKVSFYSEDFALKYIEKLKTTSKRKRRPVEVYLCENCLAWHLTSRPSYEMKENINLKRQIDNLKRKVLHLENQLKNK